MQTSHINSSDKPLTNSEEELAEVLDLAFWLPLFKTFLPAPVASPGYLPSSLTVIDENGPFSL